VTGNRARVACGIGLNVHRSGEGFAGAAYCEDVAPIEKCALFTSILQHFNAMLPLLQRSEDVIAGWEAAAAVPGAHYWIARDNALTPFNATALALEMGGALRVQRDDGTVERIDMADARILREEP
jgi:biotin-(acetyl-CoA carboxylase) ligase